LDVLLQVAEASLEELRLVLVDLTNWVDSLDTLLSKGNLGGEEVNALLLVERGLDEGALDDLLALGSLEEGVGEAGTGESHGEGSGSGTVLGLDDLITAELDAVDKGITGLTRDIWVGGLGKDWDDGNAGVTTDNRDNLGGGVGALDLGDEAGGTNDVKGGDTEKLLGVVLAGGLEDLGDDWDGGVDRVGNDQELSLRAVLSAGLGQIADDGGVGVEEIWGRTVSQCSATRCLWNLPSRVIPGLRGTPAGMTTISAPVRASLIPSGVGL
jgi:hypothetical protein